MSSEKILAAEEFLVDEYGTSIDKIQADGNHVKFCMIQFAKLHVEAALKAASENAEVNCDSSDVFQSIDKESILSAYPETNTK